MKIPLVIIIAIVAGILGFLLIYSQQRDLPVQSNQANVGTATAAAPASAGVIPASAGQDAGQAHGK